ncbi:MAG TPA: hypothetical protein VLF71_00320 [Candidatus Saccharimonadales bacterium]|nr:hypothetical protein [Candidatus Saccharimonadales bacterium]
MRSANQRGFTAVEALLVVLVLVLLGGAGWYVWHRAGTSGEPATTKVSSSSQDKSTSSTSKAEVESLNNGAVTFTLPEDWIALTGAQKTYAGCGKAVTSSVADCIDQTTLVLKQEGYTNGDQFQVGVSVFTNTGSQSAPDWFGTLGLEGTGGEPTSLTINGNQAYRYSIKPDSTNNNRLDLYYAVVGKQKAVLVHTELFNGNHYGFVTTNNYLGYDKEVDAIAKTIKLN